MIKYSITYNLEDERILPFLMKDDGASIYHHPAWLKAISKTFSHKPGYVILKDNLKNLLGLIPFVWVKSYLTGNRIVSLPFSNFSDPLVPSQYLKSAYNFLFMQFKDRCKFDLRTQDNLSEILPDFSNAQNYVVHILHLNENLQTTFDSFHARSIRGAIRRAEKNNLTIDVDNSEISLRTFYNLEINLQKRLSLPPLPYVFFENILNGLKPLGLIDIPIVWKNQKPIAAGFVLNFKDRFYIEYAASDKNYIGLNPNHKLYWEIIKQAHSNGCSKVDFGRTSIKNELLIAFKEKWNAVKYSVFHLDYPSKAKVKDEQNSLRYVLTKINSKLSANILKFEGNLIYRHFD